MNYIYLLLVSLFVLLIIDFIFNDRDIMSPSIVMCMVFIFSTMFAILNIENWKIEFSFKSYFLLISGITVFSFFDIIIRKLSMIKRKNINRKTISIQREKCKKRILEVQNWKVYITDIVVILAVFLQYKEVKRIASTAQYYGDNILYAYRMISSHTGSLSDDQYMNSNVSMLLKITTVVGFVFTFILLNNLIVYKQKLVNNIKYFPVVICYIIQSTLSGVRTGILRLVVFAIIASYALIQNKYSWKINFTFKFIKNIIIVSIIVLPTFYLSKTFLGRTDNLSFINSISAYVGGPIQHFNQYIESPPEKNEYFGQETLVGIRKSISKLGGQDIDDTVHLEYRYLNSYEFGNVYTFFRRLIQDFGMLGMYLATTLIAIMFSYFYNFKIRNSSNCYISDKRILIYSYLFYVIAMSSIDQVIHDYLRIGNIILIILFIPVLWFYTQTSISKGKIKFLKPKFLKK